MTHPNHPPLVSVGIPTYNRAESLKRAINSVINQTYANLQIIISDNASMDNTQQICEEFCQIDPRISYIRQPGNFGAGNNFKFVLEQSQGEYFMWLGDDDWIDSSYIQECMLFLAKNLEFELCYGVVNYVTFNQSTRTGENINLEEENFIDRVTNYFKLVQYNGCFYGLYKRSTLLKLQEILNQNLFAGDWIIIACLAIIGKVKSIDTCSLFRKDQEKELKEYTKVINTLNIIENLYPYQYISINFLKIIMRNRLAFRNISLLQKLKLTFQILLILFKRFSYTGNFSNQTFLFFQKIKDCIYFSFDLPHLVYSHVKEKVLDFIYIIFHISDVKHCLDFVDLNRSLKNLAVFSPVSPIKSGISDYTEELVEYLSKNYNILVFIDTEYLADFRSSSNVYICNYKLFDVLSKIMKFQRVIYQVGHNKYHNYMFKFINKRTNDIVVLHDGININNQSINNRSNHLLVVHNNYALDQVKSKYQQFKSCIIPMLIKEYYLSRNKIDLKKDLNIANKFIFSCFGIVDSSKLIYEIINSFVLNYSYNESCILLIAGHQINDTRVIDFMKNNKYRNVLFRIGLSKSDLYQYINASDVCLNLRSGSRGETSASLLRVMSCGIPVVVSNTGSFSELPDRIVYKISENPDIQELSSILKYCYSNINLLKEKAKNALEYIRTNNSPERVVSEYLNMIQK